MPRYSAIVMDHFDSPRNSGELPQRDCVGRADLGGQAPNIVLHMKAEQGAMSQITFLAFGCGVTIAAASMLTELAQGRSLEECATISAEQLTHALGGLPADKQFCAGIAVEALRDGLSQLETIRVNEEL